MAQQKFAPDTRFFPIAAKAIARFGEIYNKYQIRGVDNLPREGGALIVMYHGLVPLDFWYFGCKLRELTGKIPCALADRWVMRTPGLGKFCRAAGGVEADFETALSVLRDGHTVGVSPGGVREAISGKRNHYKLKWDGRVGFAKLAIASGVPIIPGFTENVEGLYHSPFAGSRFFQKLYEKTRLPLVPIVGLGPFPFPVPLTTWLDEPIVAKEKETPEALALRVKTALEALMAKHQPRTGQIVRQLPRRLRNR